jgi:hypothetical protein
VAGADLPIPQHAYARRGRSALPGSRREIVLAAGQ